jgi:hypothetical protein
MKTFIITVAFIRVSKKPTKDFILLSRKYRISILQRSHIVNLTDTFDLKYYIILLELNLTFIEVLNVFLSFLSTCILVQDLHLLVVKSKQFFTWKPAYVLKHKSGIVQTIKLTLRVFYIKYVSTDQQEGHIILRNRWNSKSTKSIFQKYRYVDPHWIRIISVLLVCTASGFKFKFTATAVRFC